jgi:NAD-dependent dihydropyrimidine dehydrogenase PreA subunit
MKINRESCTGCGYCLLTCPSQAIVSDGWARVIDEVCTDCNLCIHACPNDCFIPDVPLKPCPAQHADRYDVIVIGAGLGGLMAAAWLAREGRQVAVFEKLCFIGGRYTEINHRGYAVTTGAWSPMGPQSNIGRFLADVGAQVETITHWPDLRAGGGGAAGPAYAHRGPLSGGYGCAGQRGGG